MTKRVLVLFLLIAIYAAQEKWVEQYRAFTGAVIEENLDGWIVQNNFKGNKQSTCGTAKIVGGFNAFGRRATVAKTIRLPPHYKLKIKVQLWRIDSWDNEKMQIFVDGFLWEAQWNYANGDVLCGTMNPGWKAKKYDVEFLVPHNSPLVNIIMTSTLDQDANDESWGFREFFVSYLECPSKCGVCHSPSVNECFFWSQVGMSWNKAEVALEDWKLEGNGRPQSNNCAGVNIFGGQGNIGAGSNLIRSFNNLPPHFQLLVKFQFWKIDSWDNEQFRVFVDTTLAFTQNFQWNEGVQLCGADTGGNQGANWAEKVVNVDFVIPHKGDNVQLKLTSTLDEGLDNESWGVRDFFLFVGKCYNFCKSCTGPGQSDCTSCDDDFVLENGVCKEGGNWYIISKFFFNPEDFVGLKEWKLTDITGNEKDAFTKCGETQLLGGIGKFGQKSVASRKYVLPGHKKLRLKVQLWKIGLWEGQEIFIKVDGQKVFNMVLGWNDPGQINICSQANDKWKDRVIDVDQIFVHNALESTFEISSTLDGNPNQKSWGFRQFQLMYEPLEDCIIFYSECNYQGQTFEVCRDLPSLTRAKMTQAVRSIKIPPRVTIEGFQDENYRGGKVVFTTSQDCIQDFQFSFYSVRQQTHWVNVEENQIGSNLRKKRID